MRLVVLLLLAACPATVPSPAASPTPAPAKEPKQTPTTTNAPARGDARPEPVTATPGWSPAPAQSAPGLDAKRGPDAFYALAGPSPDLAAQARERALVWLRAEFGDQPIDEAMVLAEHKVDPTGLAWLHYGAHEWSQGDFALAIRGADGWFATLPIAASSKHAPLRVDGRAPRARRSPGTTSSSGTRDRRPGPRHPASSPSSTSGRARSACPAARTRPRRCRCRRPSSRRSSPSPRSCRWSSARFPGSCPCRRP